MLNAGVVTFQEFMKGSTLLLSTLHDAILMFLRDRDDVVLFGAHAVNAYVHEPRMTQDIDLVSTHALSLAQALRDHLSEQFHIGVRIRDVGERRGYRIYQLQKSENRHLVDVRPVRVLPSAERIAGVLVLQPPALIASKVIAYERRRGQPKAGTDWRDIAMLLLTFPELKQEDGAVAVCLREAGADEPIFLAWKELVSQDIRPLDEDDDW